MLATAFMLVAVLSGVLMLWQWIAATRFPLRSRFAPPPADLPPVSVLKPVKGADPGTEEALESWLRQTYPAPVEILFGTESAGDPAAACVRALLERHPGVPARLVFCPERLGLNRKVSNLIQMARQASGDLIVVSDADVEAPPGLLVELARPFADPAIGLTHCLYRLADAPTLASRWEAFVVNGDFWSQVLQNRSLHPLDYALGAALAVRRQDLSAVGGFEALSDHLADDNRLGRLIVGQGKRTELCPLVVDCHPGPAGWLDVWRHQLRWAITIRVCQRLPYFLSILANGTVWPLVWLAVEPSSRGRAVAAGFLAFRIFQGLLLEARFTGRPPDWLRWWLVPLKDLLQVGLWGCAFLKHRVVWRGVRFRVLADGRLVPDAEDDVVDRAEVVARAR